jgi:hypothetical protein
MAAVSGTALANSAFPILAIGAGASARPPTVRDTSGLAIARGAVGTNNSANQNGSTTTSAFAARDTGIDGQNGVRLAGDNGALLDLTTSLTAQEAAGQATEEGEAEDPDGLTEEEEQQVAELSRADREVRRHESAHAAVGGAYASAPSYTFQQGPDGKLYAVAGQVSIDTGSVDGDPAATIQKLQIVRSAALAPGNPSAQDRSVAAQAEAGIRQAQAELQAERAQELSGDEEGEVGASDEAGAETTDAEEAGGPERGAQQGGFLIEDRSQGDQIDQASSLVARVIDIAV